MLHTVVAQAMRRLQRQSQTGFVQRALAAWQPQLFVFLFFLPEHSALTGRDGQVSQRRFHMTLPQSKQAPPAFEQLSYPSETRQPLEQSHGMKQASYPPIHSFLLCKMLL